LENFKSWKDTRDIALRPIESEGAKGDSRP